MTGNTDDGRTQDGQQSSTFAVRLKQLRVLRGYRTARSFAQALQIDENRYTRWERGEVEPSVAMLGKMAEVLNVPVDVLVSGGDVAAGLASALGSRTAQPVPPSQPAPSWFQEEQSRFAYDKSPEQVSQNVLLTSRAHLMSLLERRVIGLNQSEIDALIARLSALPPGSSAGALGAALGGSENRNRDNR